MQESLVDMGMTCIHLSMDMQLYEVTKQVCWDDSVQFQNIIAHPGGMHITVIHRLHCEANERFSIGRICCCSLWGADRYVSIII